MTVFEKLEELGLEYRIDFDCEIFIFEDYAAEDIVDEDEIGNDRQALDAMHKWVKENKAPVSDYYPHIDGYAIIFEEGEKYPAYL